MRGLGERILRWASGQQPWTNVYGLARSLLASSTALTLAASHSATLFRPAAGIPDAPACDGLGGIALFCLLGVERLEWARWIAVGVLLLTASGWKPRWTALPHWWISFSLQTTATTVDGGDQAAAVLTALLLPVALTDRRRWHWTLDREQGARGLSCLVAASALVACRVQVAAIYFHAAVGKMRVPEWVDGTALYYWFTDPMFGLQEPFVGWLWPALSEGSVVAGLTWFVISLELALASGLVAPRRVWPGLLAAGVAFHAGIYLIHGLASFSLTMVGALILYLRPPERQYLFTEEALPARLRQLIRWKGGKPPSLADAAAKAAAGSEV